MLARMRRRVLAWGGVLVAVSSMVCIGLYFWHVGLESADKLASVIGSFVGLIGLAVAIFGTRSPSSRSSGGVPPAGQPDEAASAGTVAAQTGTSIASLDWLAEYLRTLREEVATSGSRERGLRQSGRQVVQGLYQELRELRQVSAELVDYLHWIPRGGKHTGRDWGDLPSRVLYLTEVLNRVHGSVRALDPQLEIHYPEVATAISSALVQRARVIAELRQLTPTDVEQIKGELRSMSGWNPENIPPDLDEVISRADQAVRKIDAAVEALQGLIVREFDFKDGL